MFMNVFVLVELLWRQLLVDEPNIQVQLLLSNFPVWPTKAKNCLSESWITIQEVWPGKNNRRKFLA